MIITENVLYTLLNQIKAFAYEKCNITLTNYQLKPESLEYGACSFELSGKIIEHRISKITPTKVGQFVTIWKRNEKGVTIPLDSMDHFDFIIITSLRGDNIGQFIFPKSVLVEKGIITHNGKEGKRGFRVYPFWDTTTNKQAKNTQNWQVQYFVNIYNLSLRDIDFLKQIIIQ